MLWEVDIYPAAGQPDLAAARVTADAAELGLATGLHVTAGRGYLIQGPLDEPQVERLARELLSDRLVERFVLGRPGDAALAKPPITAARLVHVLPKPGVMDPVAQSLLAAIDDFELKADAVRTLRKYWIANLADDKLKALAARLLANDAIEQIVIGPLTIDELEVGSAYEFKLVTVPLRELDDADLERLSREGQLFLKLAEMRTIRDHFRSLGRDPTDAELETIAQTWSEHCSHKTLAGRIQYSGPHGESRFFENMLKETIFAATQEIRRELGQDDWCVSVFKDNAGVVRFDDDYHLVFKVETHNHPSALEPYGGANTGIGGVIRDPLGTGLGARPVCNTDVFCFAPPDTPADSLPPGVLHPKRVFQGVVAGVRDYGNRMGIPTVNGAIYFDPRYLGNPLVFCGTAGLLPCDKLHKAPRPGDHIVAVGGRTGRDGIHGATFSSAELSSESETLSGGAVQIGNAITEKMLLDVVLEARDRRLYHAITDCGAGGFSSAVGEMGEEIGAEVWLDRIPLKYEGLSYTEMWISEAQERMVLAVPPETWHEFHSLCASEGVEATVIGRFVPNRKLVLTFHAMQVAELTMEFLHGGRPPVVREATYTPPPPPPLPVDDGWDDHTETLLRILGSLNVASKEWVIRQYDHEVQGGSVIKPLVGVANDGPSDAAVLRPVLGSRRGIALACGMNPRYGDFDTYHMAASAIDEAVRNCVAVGADPRRIAILDNFCWGDTDRPEVLGSLVRAALACHDVAIALGTPFISGKDSLNNEFRYADAEGGRRTIAIPPSLLISAIGQLADVGRAVTMDLKEPGNFLYVVGATHDELGGSHFSLVAKLNGGAVPRVAPVTARRTFAAMHTAIGAGLVRACHDMSEGGLAAAAAEMAFAGGLGAQIDLRRVPTIETTSGKGGADVTLSDVVLLFSESNSRFVCEVRPAAAHDFEACFDGLPLGRVGTVVDDGRLEIVRRPSADRPSVNGPSVNGPSVNGGRGGSVPSPAISADLKVLKEAWQSPLRW
ncbi:MAG TPA: phosphoribosylformylglycinamidine synthase subunit PurL [Pirellulales bacterium]|nr:phosphoribosylformylglycinamidine synthase subunit PurL [Pirellulales bacterium]